METPRLQRAAALALAAGLAVAFAPARAAAKPKLPSRTVVCGEVLTESLRVANNLRDCSGDGLLVGAPGITIDLGGHRIDGGLAAGSAGIDNGAGHDDVVIQNGIVSEFESGVLLQGASGNALTELRVLDNAGAGIHLISSAGNTLKGNVATNNPMGFRLDTDSDDNLVSANDSLGNGIGFYVEASSGNLFTGNLAEGSAVYGVENFGASRNDYRGNVLRGSGFDGLILDGGSNDCVVKGNQVSANDRSGIEIAGGTGNVLLGNSTHENGENGILSNTNAVTLKKNKANGNGFLGGGEGDDAGLGISVPAGATSSGNKATGNDDPNECEADDLGCYVP